MSQNVKVAVRVRPFNEREKKLNAKSCITMVPSVQQTIIINPEDGKERKFTFDHSYDSFVPRDHPAYASQTTVWGDIGESVLENAWKGYNCSLFAYGQTGSGKSYSMMGYGDDVGIIPKASQEIFKRITSNTDADVTYKVETSMLEIYMEKVRDLFNPANKKDLRVRDHPKRGTYVEGLTKSACASYDDVNKMMEVGTAARTVASTNMNATSSRAHTIFQITLSQTRVFRETGKATDKVSVINLIDLAGSERADSTGATGDRLKEGCAINQSLSCLGNVISALASNSGKPKSKRKLVPYRDSVLTQLLRSSLGGNAKTAMIAAISPADVNYDETMSTLRYADRAKQIKNKAVVNEDPNEKLIKNLKSEIEELRRMLGTGGAGAGAGAAAGAGGPDVDSLLAEERERMEKEKAEEMQRMLEQIAENERLLQEQSKSWEERLAEAQMLSRQREADLAKMGVHIGDQSDRAAIEEQAQTTPHLVNLNEDPALSGKLMYLLDKPITRFGRMDAAIDQDVCLAGLSIRQEHSTVRIDGDMLVLHPMADAKVSINGEHITDDTQLHHADRIIFGANHVFKFVHPLEREALHSEGKLSEDVEHADWSFAIAEIHKAQMSALSAAERTMREEAERDAAKMRQRVQELEALIDTERTTFKEESTKKEAEFTALEKRLQMEIEARQKEVGGDDADARTKELMDELRSAREMYEKEQQDLKVKAEALEASLRAQQQEQEHIMAAKEKRIRERSKLDEVMMSTLPLVNEVNTMSEELGKPQRFAMRLLANQDKARMTVRHRKEEHFDALVDSEMWVRVTVEDGSAPTALWHYEKFTNRLYLMREMYQAFVECGRDHHHLEALGYDFEHDPFLDPVEAVLIGRSSLYLDALTYMLDVDEKIPVLDYKGKEDGELIVRVVPHLTPAAPAPPPEVQDDVAQALTVESVLDGEQTLSSLIGQTVYFTLFIDGCRGLPSKLSTNVFVGFQWLLLPPDSEPYYTDACAFKTISPKLGYQHTFTVVVTEELCKFVSTEALEFEVYGAADVEGLGIPASTSLAMRPEDEGTEHVDDKAAELLALRSDAEAFKTELTKAQEKLQEEKAGREFVESVKDGLDQELRRVKAAQEAQAEEIKAKMQAEVIAREKELEAERKRVLAIEKEREQERTNQRKQLEEMEMKLKDFEARATGSEKKSASCVVQ